MCGVSILADFIKLSLHGMQRLQGAGRLNVLYLLVKGFGTDSLFPTIRMPMGLLQYMAQFFVSKCGQHVGIISIWMLHSNDYKIINLMCRWSVLMIIQSGYSPCTYCLAQSGIKFIVDRCGVVSQQSKPILPLTMVPLILLQ